MKEPLAESFSSCVLLINPTRYPKYVKILKKIVKKTNIPLVIESKNKEHFIEAVEDFYNSELKHLIVWGGDGTAHLAINALMKSRSKFPERGNKAIGFLRGGSGNGIQDSYEVPITIRNQLKVYGESLKNNYTQSVDLLKLRYGGEEIYGQLVGVGFDSYVLKRREMRKIKRGKNKHQIKSGLFNYMVSVLITYLKDYDNIYKDFIVELYNGKYAFRGTRVNAEFPVEYFKREVHCPMIELGTRPYYGKMFKICPDVVCNDGYMDVYLFNLSDKLSIVTNLPYLWNGWHHRINKKFAKRKKPIIERYEVKKAKIISSIPFFYHIDGELMEAEQDDNDQYSITLEVAPEAISFIVPGTFYRKFHPFDGI
ncbi:MAG: sphingosine kinase [Spirochaetes bacterium]|nr:MAG: sphingosine kinase [Spirochaetota bacterium]